MKYFTMTLALVAVLAVGSTASADYTIMIDDSLDVPLKCDVIGPTPIAPEEYGKCSWVLHFYGTQGMRDVVLVDPDHETLANVHQVFANGTLDPANGETPLLDDLPGSLPPTTNPTDFDTHFMFASATVNAVPCDSPIESCDGTNPNDLPADYTQWVTNPVVQGCFPGNGTFDARGKVSPDHIGYNFSFLGTLDPAGYDIMYIVVECETALDLRYFVGQAGARRGGALEWVDFDVPVGVPEPGTVVMLLAGALSLLGIRFRK